MLIPLAFNGSIDAIRSIELPLSPETPYDAIVTQRKNVLVIVIETTLPEERKEHIRETLLQQARERLAQDRYKPLAA